MLLCTPQTFGTLLHSLLNSTHLQCFRVSWNWGTYSVSIIVYHLFMLALIYMWFTVKIPTVMLMPQCKSSFQLFTFCWQEQTPGGDPRGKLVIPSLHLWIILPPFLTAALQPCLPYLLPAMVSWSMVPIAYCVTDTQSRCKAGLSDLCPFGAGSRNQSCQCQVGWSCLWTVWAEGGFKESDRLLEH